jgi:hypothetical protein
MPLTAPVCGCDTRCFVQVDDAYTSWFLQVLRVVRDPFTLVHLFQVIWVVLTLVVQAVKVVFEPYTCCFVQVFRVVLMLVVIFKQLRLFESLTLVVLFKCLRSSLRLLFCSSSQGCL